jgi:hypothetical protein
MDEATALEAKRLAKEPEIKAQKDSQAILNRPLENMTFEWQSEL